MKDKQSQSSAASSAGVTLAAGGTVAARHSWKTSESVPAERLTGRGSQPAIYSRPKSFRKRDEGAPSERRLTAEDWLRRGLLVYLIFAAMAYLPEALNDIVNARISYAKFALGEPIFGPSVRYVKDILMVALLGLFFWMDVQKQERYRLAAHYLPILLLLLYGTSVLAFREAGINVYQVAAGGRSLLLVLFCIKAVGYIRGQKEFIRSIASCLGWLILIEFIVLGIQYALFTGRFGVVNPFSLRLIGTFGGISIAGYMALGSSMFLYAARSLLGQTQRRLGPVLQLLCLGIAGMSGTRSAIIGCFLIVFFLVVEAVFSGRKRPGSVYLTPAIVCFSILALMGGVQAATLMADRGSIVEAQVQGGRIDMLTGFFTNNSLSVVLFGDGIGYGTNSGVNLNKQMDVQLDHQIMDGTFNSILTQFGLVTLAALIAAVIISAPGLIRSMQGKSIQLYVFIIVNLVLCISTNILEQFVYLFLLAACWAVLTDEKSAPSTVQSAMPEPEWSPQRFHFQRR
ncbi:hypothetical protein M3223_12970 [Paenibacillus pasadenensis]|uniref:hypothetical protein n=1 Tax=Paenibacillus pasadenensis TaxID=217090 RepID=UPI00203FFDE2|nr:hypothetical protein [Paenibacillus pasadenensis]MCM3748266.1 hypothetical protein [Paenibacillus pasadenensis]